MSDLPLGLLLDGVLALLLLATIFYCFTLNRRLGAIRDAGDQMKNSVGLFSTATEQAKAGIIALKVAAQDDGQKLQDAVNMARVMRDELAFLTESGDALATRLAGVRESGQANPRPPIATTAPARAPALSGAGEGPSIPAAPTPSGREGRDAAEVNAALEAARAAVAAGEQADEPDSEAERQLLQALRQVR